jgi:hypothetical protein
VDVSYRSKSLLGGRIRFAISFFFVTFFLSSTFILFVLYCVIVLVCQVRVLSTSLVWFGFFFPFFSFRNDKKKLCGFESKKTNLTAVARLSTTLSECNFLIWKLSMTTIAIDDRPTRKKKLS